MENIQRAKFYPVSSLDDKRNFKRVHRIERDGSIIERVFLDVPDVRHREYLICLHYMRHLVRHFLCEDIGLNIIGRDNPWDFKLELSTGRTFNVEITSVADNAHHFEVTKREERFTRWSCEEKIPLHELKKLLFLFPNEQVAELVNEYKGGGLGSAAFVPNPFFTQEDRIFISTLFEPMEQLEKQLTRVITNKAEKQHEEKENTALIIDNRTCAFDVEDYYQACEKLSSFISVTPFSEIWFYTGYCSNDDGNNAEFSFAPMKVTDEQSLVLGRMASSGNIDDSGRFVW